VLILDTLTQVPDATDRLFLEVIGSGLVLPTQKIMTVDLTGPLTLIVQGFVAEDVVYRVRGETFADIITLTIQYMPGKNLIFLLPVGNTCIIPMLPSKKVTQLMKVTVSLT